MICLLKGTGDVKMKKYLLLLTILVIFTGSFGPNILANTNADTTPPEITIENPVQGFFHFSGIKLFETKFDLIGETMGFGGFRVKPVQAYIIDDVDDPEDITVTLYVDDMKERDMSFNDENGLYEGKWIGPALGTFTMKIVASDSSGNTAEEIMTVWYFCFVPEA